MNVTAAADSEKPASWSRPSAIALALLGLVGVAALLRVWGLSQLPPGYWYDEAHKSVVALAISRGQEFPIYVTDYQGIEAGYFWLLAGWFRLFGPSVYGTRYLAAVLGTAAVPLTYWAVATTYSGHPRARLVALAAAGWLTFLLWHLVWSRLGFEVISVPLFSIALLGLMAWAWRRPQAWPFAIAGAVLGLSLYTNPAARVLPLQSLVTFALFSYGSWRRRVQLGLIFMASAALVFAPLGLFFLRNPQWFVARAAFTSSVTRAAGWSGYASNVVKTLLSINFQGDVTPRHNLSLRPALEPISSAWMVVGLASLWPRRPGGRELWRAHAAVLGCLVINLLPGILTDGAPAFGRTLGAAPFLVMLPALGVGLAASYVTTQAGRALLFATLAVAAGWNLWNYFYQYPRQPGMFDALEIGQWDLIQAAMRASETGTGYLVLGEPGLAHPATRFAAQLQPGDLRLINGNACLAYPAETTAPVTLGTLEEWRPALTERLPGANVQILLHEPEVYPYGALISLPAGYTAPANSAPAVARLGDSVDLLAVALPTQPVLAGTMLPVTLRWRVVRPLSGRYNVFVHLVGPNQPLVSGADGEPCGGWYPTSGWHPNEVIEHTLQLSVPQNLAPGEYSLAVGMYDWMTGVRLLVAQPNAREPDRAFVGTIMVQ